MPAVNYDYDFFKRAADFIADALPADPDVAVILGTGLGEFHKKLSSPIEIPYADIPGFPPATAPGHAGKLVFGELGGRRVLCMAGRFHRYEGYDYELLTLPVRLFSLLHAKYTVVTNAAGGVDESYRPGDVMIITDHIKLNGDSPLMGRNVDLFGPRFFDVSDMYTRRLVACAEECGRDSALNIHKGVYMFFTGPQFETAAEIRAARLLGAQAVGMSTVTEALTAAHCGMPLLGISVITNMATGVLGGGVDHSEVETVAGGITEEFGKFVSRIIERVDPDTLEIAE